ncbi:SRPBCC domain-containing protein [Streptomyces sp. MUM 203J]|uniref:SRPBCC domain-containing protein n=1 Tax=Streptomyces sp. MUM 203J TaxID=2791990 RepID=UPI001F035B32|nr:SRPBCC domain-containing protein [Streptomyces sp. MUM 203J]MCH0541826.1 SRPBCC domain-containing protein [Streptomyces sp. MUM 203J]
MPTGLTRDAGWQIGVSRTLPLPVGAVWAFVAGPEGTALWLGTDRPLPVERGASYETADGVRGEIRSHRPGDRVRLTYGDTTVQVAVSPAADPGRAVLRFHQEHLASAEERERRRDHWRAVMDRVEAALLPGGTRQ